MSESVGILVVGHGSPRAAANEGFIGMVGRLAARLRGATVLHGFFSIASPSIPDQVGVLAARGIRRIVLMPYFLYRGQHVSKDIPGVLAECRQKFPQVSIEELATLENEPALEEIVVERLAPYAGDGAALPTEGKAIERRSFEIIDSQLNGVRSLLSELPDGCRGEMASDPFLVPFLVPARAVLRRIIHATADFSFARSLRVHPEAIARGVAAMKDRRPVICDVKMLAAGVTHVGGEVVCAISEPRVIELAKERGSTRAAAAMEFLADRIDGAIVAIGNAPTALWKLMEMARAGGSRPAVVVGLPVGFVGARESKMALIESQLCYITNTSNRGGSPAAAAAVNALAELAKEADRA